MFRPFLWPYSGSCITKDGYIEILQMFVLSTDVKYEVLTMNGLKYILRYKIHTLIFVIN